LKTLPNFLIFFTKLGHCIQAFIFYNGQRKTLLFIVLSNFKLLFQKQNVLIAFYAVKMKHKCVDLKKKMDANLRQQKERWMPIASSKKKIEWLLTLASTKSLANQPIRGLPLLGLI
jgi:predicted ATP-grasp superfamily ATP-dependent carboligase